MSCMNASVHDLHHCTKLQLSTRCGFGVMTIFQSGKSARTGICTIVRGLCNNTHFYYSRRQESITLKQRSVHAPEYRNKYWRGWFTWQPRLLKIVPPK